MNWIFPPKDEFTLADEINSLESRKLLFIKDNYTIRRCPSCGLIVAVINGTSIKSCLSCKKEITI